MKANAIKRSRFKLQHKGNYSGIDHHINTAAEHEMATLKANGSAPREPEGPGRSSPASSVTSHLSCTTAITQPSEKILGSQAQALSSFRRL